MKIQLHPPQAFTHIGNRKRNEDCLYPEAETAHPDQNLFIVCDGMGGEASGQEASRLVCECLVDYFATYPQTKPDAAYFQAAIDFAQDKIDSHLQEYPQMRGMGTTVALLYFTEDGAWVVHVGDSRIYHLRDGKIRHQTTDHTLVNEWLRQGLITENEASIHPKRHVLTRALQGNAIERVRVEAKLLTDVQEGDVFVLCTDGLLEFADNEKIAALSLASAMDESLLENLLKEAKDANGDNASLYYLSLAAVNAAEHPAVAATPVAATVPVVQVAAPPVVTTTVPPPKPSGSFNIPPPPPITPTPEPKPETGKRSDVIKRFARWVLPLLLLAMIVSIIFEWRSGLNKNTSNAAERIDRSLNVTPDSPQATNNPNQSKALAEAEEEDWSNALIANTEDAYKSYLTKYPNGTKRPEAEQKLKDLATIKVKPTEPNPKPKPDNTPKPNPTLKPVQPSKKAAVTKTYDAEGGLYEGLKAVKTGGKWGYADAENTEKITPKYTFAGRFAEGLAGVSNGKKFGFIDKKGTVVIPFEYDDAQYFDGGKAKVKKGGKWFVIDKNNKPL